MRGPTVADTVATSPREAMNPMRERHRATINELRTTIECLPRHTRVAMLEGIRTNEIIVGAYTSDGGICPMLAAHRAGGRTDFISFAQGVGPVRVRDQSRAQPASGPAARPSASCSS